MSIAQIHFFSESLKKEVGFNAILPDRQTKAGPYPVFYLLHGLSDDYTAWLRWTSIERYVRSLPLIVVMPDGDRRFYCDWVDGPQYEKALVEDLLGFVDRYFQTIPRAKGRAIGGLSMGGYGAVKLGLKYPNRFCSITAHSGVYALFRGKAIKDIPPHLRGIAATAQLRNENDPFWLAQQLDPKKAPAIWIDCGLDDGLLEHNRKLDKHLTKLGIAHEYHEFPGAHEWSYWDEHVQEAIAFHCRAFGIR
jgi:putative tributyrin esterase